MWEFYESLPDLTYERLLAALDALLNFALVLIGAKALGQLKIAKTNISTRVQREAAKETALQLEAWASRILTQLKESHEALMAAGVKDYGYPMQRFDKEELAVVENDDVRNHASRYVAAMQKDPKLYAQLIDTCNAMEALAMYFETGIADEEIAFEPLYGSFCPAVEKHYPLYCMHRKSSSPVNFYPYTISLYERWSQRRSNLQMQIQQPTARRARVKAATAGAHRRPIGS